MDEKLEALMFYRRIKEALDLCDGCWICIKKENGIMVADLKMKGEKE